MIWGQKHHASALGFVIPSPETEHALATLRTHYAVMGIVIIQHVLAILQSRRYIRDDRGPEDAEIESIGAVDVGGPVTEVLQLYPWKAVIILSELV